MMALQRGADMIKWTFPVIIKRRWVWVSHTCRHGNKYEAALEYAKQQAAKGVIIQGDDMSQAWMQWVS